MLQAELTNLITLEELQEKVSVSPRTVRKWVADGLLQRPLKVSAGYCGGVKGYYTPDTVDKVRVLQETKHLPTDERSRMLRNTSRYSYRIEDDGTLVLTIKPRGTKKE